MRVAKGVVVVAVAAAIGVVSLWQFGCDENPTGPKPYKPKDYVLYWNRNGYDSAFFAYYTLSQRLDTFYMPGTRVYDMNTSADGRRLYISYSDKTRVISTVDHRPLVDLPYSGGYGVTVSPDNRYIAVHSGNLRILSTRDYSVVFEDTLAFWRTAFSANGHTLYAFGPASPCRLVYRLDLRNGFQSDFICVPDDIPISRVVPSIDEKLLFMFRSLGSCNMLFDVFDVAGDSLVFRDAVAPGCGDLVVSPDNRYVYFTGPGDLHGWPPLAYSFAKYDIRNRTIDSLQYWSVCGDTVSHGFAGENLVITPDGHFLAVGECSLQSRMVLYDSWLGDTVKVECWPFTTFWYLTCQNAR
jgi:dipeptidyl aminopeptidase/acylaminoacyl peptidase